MDFRCVMEIRQLETRSTLRCQRLERLNLTECLVQEAVRRARLQAILGDVLVHDLDGDFANVDR